MYVSHKPSIADMIFVQAQIEKYQIFDIFTIKMTYYMDLKKYIKEILSLKFF